MEHILRRFASQCRFSRRILVDTLMEAFKACDWGKPIFCATLSPRDQRTGFGFWIIPESSDEIDYDAVHKWTQRYCKAIKYRMPEVGDAVCVAILANNDPNNEQIRFSIPVTAMITQEEWDIDEGIREDARKVSEKLNFLNNLENSKEQLVSEYPSLSGNSSS
jgi:hypothetical protein